MASYIKLCHLLSLAFLMPYSRVINLEVSFITKFIDFCNDLFGNLEFAVCEVAGVFQAGEGLFEVVGLGQAVGNLVEDGV